MLRGQDKYSSLMTVDLLDPCDRSSMSPCDIFVGKDENGRYGGGINICLLRITPGRYTWLGYHEIGIKIPRVLVPLADIPRYCGRSYCVIAIYFGLAIFGVDLQNDNGKDAHRKWQVRAVA